METLITAFIFGLIAGVLPGPMMTAGFYTILKNPNGFSKVFFLPFIAGGVEITIGIAMVQLGTEFFTDEVLFVITVLGLINLLYITASVFHSRKNFTIAPQHPENSQEISHTSEVNDYMAISYKEAFFLTLLNGELYIFWLVICVPIALKSENSIPHGGTIFVVTMVLGVALMTWFLFFLMHRSRKSFQNKKFMNALPYIISVFFLFIGINMLQTAIKNFPW